MKELVLVEMRWAMAERCDYSLDGKQCHRAHGHWGAHMSGSVIFYASEFIGATKPQAPKKQKAGRK